MFHLPAPTYNADQIPAKKKCKPFAQPFAQMGERGYGINIAS